MSEVVEQITRYIEAHYADAIERADTFAASLQVSHTHRRFVVARMGTTGSTWLAKLLNSHPDVFCSHEQIVPLTYPAAGFGAPDIERLIEILATNCMHGAYAAAGDVGSVWSGYALALSGKFTTGLLIRHPARLVNRRLASGTLYLTTIDAKACRAIEALWGISMDAIDPVNQAFIHDLHTFACQVFHLDRIDCLMRIEDLRDAEQCSAALKTLTGIDYPHHLVETALASRINTGPGSLSVPRILDQFTLDQRSWYERILGSVAEQFGYDLYSDTTEVRHFVDA